MQAGSASSPAHWIAALLLFCVLLAPTTTFAASPTRPVSAPLVQNQTVERWVDAIYGNDSNNCTREVVPPEDEDDEEVYVYHACATITRALSLANPGDIIHVAGRLGGVPYPEVLAINKNVTIIGGYISPFAPQIDPPRAPNVFRTVIEGSILIQGAALTLVPPDITGEAPMEVRLETLEVASGGGIDIFSGAVGGNPPRAANRVHVDLQSVVVRNNYGPGISITGVNNKLSITESNIQNNTSPGDGGGIYATGGSVVDLGEGTIIQGNNAVNGAGIAASGALTITTGGGITLTANIASGHGGGIYANDSILNVGSDTAILGNQGSRGAGVYLASGNNATISSAVINDNGSTSTSEGGGLYVGDGSPVLENLEIKGNTAVAGGGLYLVDLDGGELSSSDILSNSAITDGGGYYIQDSTVFSATSLTVQGNQAERNGGGGYITGGSPTRDNPTISGSTFTENIANASGGGLYVDNSAVTLESNEYTFNQANLGGGLYLNASDGATARSNTFTENNATHGGGIYATGNNSAQLNGLQLIANKATQGGGLYVVNSTLTFASSTLIQGNSAATKGGGGYLGSNARLNFASLDVLENESSEGAGLYADAGSEVTTTGTTTFIGNKATAGMGGGFYLQDGGTTEIANLYAQDNEATNGGGFYASHVTLHLGLITLMGNAATSGQGGGAYFANANVIVTSTAILQDNQASVNGGGIYATATTIAFQNGAQFTGNKALGGSGGGIYLDTSGGLSIKPGAATFSENIASAHGGGIFADAATVEVATSTKLENNVAQGGNGGGFHVTGSSLALGGVTLEGNSASMRGGGGYFTNGTLNIVKGTLFDDNHALADGGGLAVFGATSLLIDNASFTNNRASSAGGALYLENSALTVQNGVNFTGNHATTGSGGAIFAEGGDAVLNGITPLTFHQNKADKGGGALYITTGTFFLVNSNFSENDGGAGSGGGAYLKANSATLTNNSFSKNLADSGAALHLADTPSANLNNLQLIENSSSGAGGALYLSGSTAALDGLTVRGNQAGDEGGGIYALFSRIDMSNTLIVANRVNTLNNYAAGLYVGNSELNVTHSTIANNAHQQLQGSAHGFYVAPPVTSVPVGAPTQSSVTLVNSIVSGHSVGLNLLVGNSATFNAVLWNNAHFDWTGAGNFSMMNSRRGDPRFVNANTHDYHLRRDSAAFDQGITSPINVDRDGVARSQGLAPDLGAYEHRYNQGLYLTSSISPAFVHPGDTVTIRLRVQNQSVSTADGVILRATLPTQLSASATSHGSCQSIFCEINLGALAVGTDVTVEINATVNGPASAAGLVNLITNATLATSNFTTSDTATTATTYLHSCKAEVNGAIYHTVQAALDAASEGQTIRISGACGDLHQNGGPGQLLTINKSVTLQGGWNESFTTHDPATYPSILDSAKLGRVVYLQGNVAPVFENLIIRNGNASGLGGGPAGKDAGGGVYINGGTPTFKQVDIANNHSPDLGAGVYLTSPHVVSFEGGFVRNNSGAERGGGLYIDQSAPILTGVNITGNNARGGGGIYLYQSPAQLLDNAPTDSAPTCYIANNISSIMPNYAPGPDASGLPVLWLAPGGGGGIVLDESAAIIRGCAIQGNVGRVGGGVYLHNSAATLENNLITRNRAQQPNPNAILIGPGGVRDGDGGGIVLDNADPATLILRGLLLGSNEAMRGSGMLARLARSGTLALPHFTINNNVGGNAIFALGESHLAFNSTIVAFNTHPTNASSPAIFAQSGSNGEAATITLDRTLWYPPTQTRSGSAGGASVTTSADFTGDPAFRDDGYHLKRISFAFGMGNGDASFADRDGDARPTGPQAELGADEYATATTVRYVMVGGTGSAPCTDYRTPCASLQTALDAANDGDWIKMAGGTYSGVRNDGGRIHFARIEKSVTIEGGYFPRTDNNDVTEGRYTPYDWEEPHPAENPTIIDVSNQGRVFFISGDIAPTLSNLTLRRGNALALGDGPAGSTGGAGGAVYIDSASPIFKNVIVQDSRANFGSGFYLRNAGGTYSGLTVLENGTGISEGVVLGGGFYVEGGQPTLQSITIQSNFAITGAGVYLDSSAAILVQNNIEGNGDATTLDGGGIYAVGDGATVITNTVATNRAQRGGGLYLHNSNATVRGNTMDSNRAGSDSPSTGQNDVLGGGLYVVGGAPQVTANTIRNNQAVHPHRALGGGVYLAETSATLSGNAITANQAHRGGGLYFAATSGVIVENNTITLNRTQADGGNIRQAGGGVYLASAAIHFTQNSLGQNSAAYGAGLYVAGAGHSQITQNTFTSNVASQDGGGIYLDGSDAELENNTLQENRTTGGRGGGIYAQNGLATLRANSLIANTAALEGGGIFLSQDGSTLQGDTIQGNQSGDGGGIYITGPSPEDGRPAPWINQVTIAENRANNHGGGLFLASSSAQITLNMLRDNEAAVDGGGALIQGGAPAAFMGNAIRNNRAGDQGGGLYISQGSPGRYHSNAVVDNRAGHGGGIFVAGASPTLIHTTLARNGTGLIAVTQDSIVSTVVLTNTLVAEHTLGIQGESGTTVTLFATLWDNNAAKIAGAVTTSKDHHGAARFAADGYHLSANSDAANKGIPGNVTLGRDLDGESRFQGNGPDLGADELTASCAIIIDGNSSNVYDNLQQAIFAAPHNGELRMAGTCAGVQTHENTPQVAYIPKNLTLRGGYRLGEWETASPETQPSVLDARGQGRVLYVASGVQVTLANITLINGTAEGLGGGQAGEDAGGNLYVQDAEVTLARVSLIHGRATIGGGLYLKAPVARVTNSHFRDNIATRAGGALYLGTTPASVTVRGSSFTNNRGGNGAAIYVAAGAPVLLGNHLRDNQTSGSSGRGGGIFLEQSNTTLNRNRIESNRANTGGGLYVAGGQPALTNNLLVKNTSINSGGAIFSVDAPIHLRHNTLVANATLQNEGGALAFATPVSSQALALTNNILVDHSLAITVATGNQLTVRANLWHNNETNWSGPVTEESGNIYEDPRFVNSAGGDYRLQENSPAVDRGANAGVNDDIDGQNRPARQGFDIGADEYLHPSINASLTALPDPVASGGQQTYLLRVINNGDVDVSARVQITLPAVLTPEGPMIWEDVAIGRGAIWEHNLVAMVDANYTGALNALMGVTTDQGATATTSVATTAAAISGEILEFNAESVPDPAEPGSTIELRLRLVNRSAIPVPTTIKAQLPDGLTTSSPLTYEPTVSGPDGTWSTRMHVTIAPDVPRETATGEANQLVTTFHVESDQGISRTYSVTTILARPAVQVSHTVSPRPAIAGRTLIYSAIATNTGNIPLAATISNTFPAQVALEQIAHGQPFEVTLAPGQVWQQRITTTVEAGYVGPLAGSVQVTTDAGVHASAQEQINAQAQQLTPTATAKGGNWHDPSSWDPPVVPAADAIILIPENVSLFSNRPLVLAGLVNNGSLELHTSVGSSQAITVTDILENYGEILGKDATRAGQVGLTLNLATAVLYNEGTICAGDGAPDGGAGGDLIIIAGSTTNKGTFCAGNGAGVNSASANLPGGSGGDVLLSFDPGLFTNYGKVIAGSGGSSHPDSMPPQPGGDGGDITLVATAAARLDNSDLRGGQGGTGSEGAASGNWGQVVVGAPIISNTGTRFSDGTVLLIRQNDSAYNFAATAPDTVFLSKTSGVAVFPVRVFNRGARPDTFVATPLATPDGWQVNNLPAALRLGAFRSNLIFVVLSVPLNQPGGTADQPFSIVVTSQQDAANQIVIPLRVVTTDNRFHIQLPQINR